MNLKHKIGCNLGKLFQAQKHIRCLYLKNIFCTLKHAFHFVLVDLHEEVGNTKINFYFKS